MRVWGRKHMEPSNALTRHRQGGFTQGRLHVWMQANSELSRVVGTGKKGGAFWGREGM